MMQAKGGFLSEEVAKVPNDSSHRISRRGFVYQTGVLAGGALWGAAAGEPAAAPAASDAIPNRILGKTGVPLSVMTLGTAPAGFIKPHNPKHVADCVNAAIDLGINAIDTAPAYDVAEEGVGLALGKRRKQVFVSTKIMADDGRRGRKDPQQFAEDTEDRLCGPPLLPPGGRSEGGRLPQCRRRLHLDARSRRRPAGSGSSASRSTIARPSASSSWSPATWTCC